MQGEELKAEKNMLLPDITLGYFNGTNNYAGAQHYQGFEVGLGIPLFFGEQRAKVNAKKLPWRQRTIFRITIPVSIITG